MISKKSKKNLVYLPEKGYNFKTAVLRFFYKNCKMAECTFVWACERLGARCPNFHQNVDLIELTKVRAKRTSKHELQSFFFIRVSK